VAAPSKKAGKGKVAPARRPGRPRARELSETGGDARGDIIRAAVELFAENGIDAVTMAEIAERSGLQQPSLYYYFRSKRDLLGHILADVNRIPLQIVQQARSADGPVAVRIWWLIYQDVVALCRFPFDINEVHRFAARHPDDLAAYWAERQRLNDQVESLIAAGIEAGELREIDPRLAALALLANDEGTQNWYRPIGGQRLTGRTDPALGDYTVEELAGYMADVALRHLLVRPARLDAVRARASMTTLPA
jgi:AcrR family transcriptional regulator